MNHNTTSLSKLSKFEQLDLLLHRKFIKSFLSIQGWIISMAIDMAKDKIKSMQKACKERGEPPFPHYYTI